jgi:N,N-dimethylformamidase
MRTNARRVAKREIARAQTGAAAGRELIGYADRLSVEPGQSIQFMVSTTEPEYDAVIVRLIHGDTNPAGPGAKEEVISSAEVNGRYAGRRQHAQTGSYILVTDAEPLRVRSLTLQAWIFPTMPTCGRRQALLSRWCSDEQAGYGLFIGPDGRLVFEVGGAAGTSRVTAETELRPNKWYFIAATFDSADRRATVYQRPLSPWTPTAAFATVRRLPATADPSADRDGIPFRIAAAGSCTQEPNQILEAYDGKIDRPRLFARALSDQEIVRLADGESAATLDTGALVGAWDFGASPESTIVRDSGPLQLHGTAVNMPTRAVTGFNWTGSEIDFRLAPSEYSAVHFHSDDIEDAGWSPDFDWTVPTDLGSGVYAARLSAVDYLDHIPFVVRAAPNSPEVPIVVLLPTMTYLAYANERMGDPMQPASPPDWPSLPEPLDAYLAEHPEFGKSLYDLHDDGSGVAYSSALRPVPNLRPRYTSRFMGGAARHLAGDLYLIDWLEEKGFAHDVATDGDLHAQGLELLARYRVLITGGHPEYWSAEMLTAIERWIHGGGRVMYLGGNGFFWVTTVHPERPNVIEVRRGHTGSEPWEPQPGQLHHSTTGERGGLWRYRGRLPNRIFGIGFSAQGADGNSVGYRRRPGTSEATDWVFDGVAEDPIGHYGLVMGGAVGDEIDRADTHLGTPDEAVILASSEPLGRHYAVADEDKVTRRGGRLAGEARSDIVLLESPSGGAVFSVGSISWSGSLSHNDYQNGISRITENVLRRFAEVGNEPR